MEKFMHEHPWMTFFIATAAISGVANVAIAWAERNKPAPQPLLTVNPLPNARNPNPAAAGTQLAGARGWPFRRGVG